MKTLIEVLESNKVEDELYFFLLGINTKENLSLRLRFNKKPCKIKNGFIKDIKEVDGGYSFYITIDYMRIKLTPKYSEVNNTEIMSRSFYTNKNTKIWFSISTNLNLLKQEYNNALEEIREISNKDLENLYKYSNNKIDGLKYKCKA